MLQRVKRNVQVVCQKAMPFPSFILFHYSLYDLYSNAPAFRTFDVSIVDAIQLIPDFTRQLACGWNIYVVSVVVDSLYGRDYSSSSSAKGLQQASLLARFFYFWHLGEGFSDLDPNPALAKVDNAAVVVLFGKVRNQKRGRGRR